MSQHTGKTPSIRWSSFQKSMGLEIIHFAPRVCFLVVLLSLLLVSCSSPSTRPVFTRPSITVVMDNNYPPYVFLDDEGVLQGILVDQWQLWEKKTGISVELSAMDWGEAQERMQRGEYDVIDTIFYNEQRAKIYDFSKPYVTIDVPIFFSNKISGINSPESLKGFPVAVKTGDAAIDVLQQKEVKDLIAYPSYEAIIEAAKNKEVVTFVVDAPPAYYFLYKYNLQNQFNETKPLYSGAFHRAVLKENADTLPMVEWGFAQISQAEYKTIDQKWFGSKAMDKDTLLILKIIGAGVALFAVLLIVWNQALRSMIRKRTLELQDAVHNLTESEQKFRQLVASVPGAVYRSTPSPQGSVTYLSDIFEAISGYSAAEFTQKKGRLPNDIIHPQDAEAASGAIQCAVDAQQAYNIEYRIITQNGETRWVVDRGQAVIDVSGNVARLEGVLLDITDRKDTEQALRSSEENLRTTIESMDDLVFVFGADKRVVNFFQSSKFNNLYLSPDVFIGKTLEELNMPADVVQKTHQSLDVLEHLQRVMSFDYSLPLLDGGVGWYSARLSRRVDGDGKYAGATSVIRDITERKRVEEDIRRLNAELEERVAERTAWLELSNRELQTFSYSISHDLRAPLRTLNNFSQILIEEYGDKLDTQGKTMLRRIRAASTHLDDLIEALSKLARITRSDIQVETVNLGRIAVEIAALLKASQPERRVEWIIALEVIAEADPALIRIVLENLINNAWKFTSHHPKGRIEFGVMEQEGEKVYFVRDDGAGFDMQYAEKLFGPFQRLHLVTEFEGTGIGLAIVQRILNRHGGRIRAEGAVEQGATFYFTLADKE